MELITKATSNKKADVCLLLEGTYPFISGGVSSWVHQLILNQPHITFHIVAILPYDFKPVVKYDIPKNVLSIKKIFLQDLPLGDKKLSKQYKTYFYEEMGKVLVDILGDMTVEQLKKILNLIAQAEREVGSEILFNSKEAWEMLLKIYKQIFKEHSFLDFFWSWRNLFGGFFSIILTKLPEAYCYHTLCTGYAGLLTAKASIEKEKPCFITEHGIYTNERRIEITAANWLKDQFEFNLELEEETGGQQDLRSFWTNVFLGYSRVCYAISKYIITLYEGNRELQIADGAPPEKCYVVPNGVDIKRFLKLNPSQELTEEVALIGRVVPIKDIKTFIRAVSIVKENNLNIKAYIIGPIDEDEEYRDECFALVEALQLQETIEFTGKVNIEEFLKKIDIIVLTSLSEAQPLTLLEAGAVGIPSVATNVGSCSEIIKGRSIEEPKIGEGGIVTGLSNSKATADAILKLLNDNKFYSYCSKNIKERVHKYYDVADQHETYRKIYDELVNKGKKWQE